VISIGVLLAVAAVAHGLAKALRLPAIPLLLLGGVLLSALGFVPEGDLLGYVIVLGVSVLVFAGGTELNPRRARSWRPVAVRVGLVQFTVVGCAAFALALLLGYTAQVSLYLALALSASSTLVVVRLLQQRLQLFEPFGRLVIGVLLLQDAAVVLMMPVVVRFHDGFAAIASGVLGAVALLALAWLMLRSVSPWILNRLHADDERLLLVVLSVLFAFIGIADLLGLPIVAGAFVGGVALSPFPVSGIVRGQLISVSDFFNALFFTALGVLLSMPTFEELGHALAFIVLVLLVTPPLVTAIAERYGLSARSALESGLLLSQTSEFSIVVALQGLVLGQLSQGTFTVIALVTAITMALTPFYATDALTWRLLRYHPTRRVPEPERPPRDHVLLLGCGENGMPILETLFAAGVDVVAVDDDPAVIAQLRDGGIHAIRGDGSDYNVLRRAGAADARLIISTVRRPLDNEPVLRFAPGVPLIARVFEAEDAERLEALGATPVLYSQAAAEDFLRWYEAAEVVGVERERRMLAREADSGR
jgi:Kef-type K+ transport system membrane component KefB